MYTSLDWLNELVSVKTIQLETLINKLTLGGFEVEEILEIDVNNKKRTVLDISATANRADSLSIKGIAKEITALLNQPSNVVLYSDNSTKYKNLVNDNINRADFTADYSTFVTLTIENLENLTSPKWIQEKLICSKVEPVNNLLDFQNYILLETGYPFEFYDLEKIQKLTNASDFQLQLNSVEKPLSFLANNDLTYELNSEILVVEANQYPISIGGIISNHEVAYNSKTTSLLIEGSIFSSKKIRQQSRALGLRTDRSARYEKGLNNSYFTEALIRLITLLKITNPNLICKLHTASEVEQLDDVKLLLEYENIIEILGPVQNPKTKNPIDISPIEVTEYLKRLNFDFTFNQTALEWLVQIPKDRIDDLEREIDLIEEIGRLHGFNNFITTLPPIPNIGKEDFSYQIRKKLTNCFINTGFNELLQYSLVGDKTAQSIPLVNPLTTDCSTLRTSLLPSLVKITSENLKQGNNLLQGFEYGHVFEGNLKTTYKEFEVISGIFGGTKIKQNWDQSGQPLSWFEGKGQIEEIFNQLNISVIWKQSTSSKYEIILHPYRTAELYLETGEYLGVFGQIHRVLAKQLNLPVDLFLFEFNFDSIRDEFKNKKLALYNSYSTYPKITKDLSFVVDRTTSFDSIKHTLIKNGTNYLKDIKLLDEYRGGSIPDHQTSFCIQLTFQSSEKTLITKEIEEIIDTLQSILTDKYKVSIRA
jgi:phenylalanyl-tRNA synthetase beta chain